VHARRQPLGLMKAFAKPAAATIRNKASPPVRTLPARAEQTSSLSAAQSSSLEVPFRLPAVVSPLPRQVLRQDSFSGPEAMQRTVAQPNFNAAGCNGVRSANCPGVNGIFNSSRWDC
jgi:hypothetical protein